MFSWITVARLSVSPRLDSGALDICCILCLVLTFCSLDIVTRENPSLPVAFSLPPSLLVLTSHQYCCTLLRNQDVALDCLILHCLIAPFKLVFHVLSDHFKLVFTLPQRTVRLHTVPCRGIGPHNAPHLSWAVVKPKTNKMLFERQHMEQSKRTG